MAEVMRVRCEAPRPSIACARKSYCSRYISVWAMQVSIRDTDMMRHLRHFFPHVSSENGERRVCLEQEMAKEPEISHLEHAWRCPQRPPSGSSWGRAYQSAFLVSILAYEGEPAAWPAHWRAFVTFDSAPLTTGASRFRFCVALARCTSTLCRARNGWLFVAWCFRLASRGARADGSFGFLHFFVQLQRVKICTMSRCRAS